MDRSVINLAAVSVIPGLLRLILKQKSFILFSLNFLLTLQTLFQKLNPRCTFSMNEENFAAFHQDERPWIPNIILVLLVLEVNYLWQHNIILPPDNLLHTTEQTSTSVSCRENFTSIPSIAP